MKSLTKRSCLQQITPYIPGKPVEELERELGLTDVIKMASNENPLGPSPQAVEAIKGALSKISFYPDGNVYLLKKDLSERLGLSEGNIILGNGEDELIALVTATYLNPGDEIIMADPSFPCFELSTIVMDAIPRKIPSKNFCHDLEAFLAAVNSKTKLIYVCNPNNPTGTIVSHGQLKQLLDSLPPGILVIIDEAYNEYVTNGDYPSSLTFLAEGYNVLILRTFSKIYGLAGLRIGYGLAAKEVITDMHAVREPFNVNSVAQVAALAALKDEEHLRRGRESNQRSKEYLYGEFERLGLDYVPTEANFVFFDIKAESKDVFEAMLRKGVIVRPGFIFGYPQFLRVTFGTDEQNRRFILALEESLKEVAAK